MTKKILLLLSSALFFLNGLSQNTVDRCGTMQYHEYLKQTRPNYQAEFTAYNQMIDQYMNTNQFASRTATANITIPVVIHILYNTAVQNISDAQATSQFSVLNNDFQRLNADTINTPTAFRSVAGGVAITFCLAQRDPSGNATTGIVHKSTTTAQFTTDNKVKSSAQGGDDAWDVTRYMNIWVCNIGGGILGYGEFPTSSLSNTYGLVLNYTATGTMGTAAAPYNKGRTGTHEFGHCFNLNHTWGDNGQCGNTDNCPDTPPQTGGTTSPPGCNYGTPTYPWQPNTCTRPDGIAGASVTNTNGDMFMNYMDYTDDAVMNIFTKNQCARMLAVVTTAPWNVLASSNGCTPVTSLDAGIANILSPVNGTSICATGVTPQVTLTNAGNLTLTSAKILYKMDAAATQTLNWTGSLATSASTVLTLNAFTGLTTAAHTFSVWVTTPNGGIDANAANNSQTSTFTVTSPPAGAALPFVERFDATTFPPAGWIQTASNTLNAANNWARFATATGIPVAPTTTACARMDNYSGSTIDITGQLDALRSPAISLVTANSTTKLKFDVSYKLYSTTSADSLNVYLSSDCGSTWTRLYSKGGTQLATGTGTLGAAYTPTSNAQWRRDSLSLAPYAGLSSVYIKFESRSAWGNYVYLDNINVTNTATTTAVAPTASIASIPAQCPGTTVALTDQSANSPTSWSWTMPGASPATSASQNPSITYAASGTYTITLTATNAGGTSTPYTKTLTVNPLPTVSVASSTVCSGTTATITASGASAYLWNTGGSTAAITASPASTTVYSVIGTSALSCTNVATGTITVKALPTVAATGAVVCAGSGTVIMASGASTYTWSGGPSTAGYTVTPTSTTIYTVTATGSNACINTQTTTVTVNALPPTSIISSTICTGSTGTLSASGANTYLWSTGATGANITASPTGNTNYTVTGTSATGCVKTATGSIIVGSAPVISLTSATVCAGSSAVLSASGVTSYTWTSGPNTASYNVTPTGTTVYTVSGNLTGCAATAIKTATVTVNAIPNVTANSATICSGAAATLTSAGASTYLWNTGATGPALSVSPTTTTVYSVTGTNAAGCVKTITANVTVNTSPNVTVNSATICSGSTAALTSAGAATYLWNTGATGAALSVSPTGNTTYSVTGTDAAGCAKTVVANVTVNALPSVNVSSATICSGSTANLTASGASTYTWNTGATGSSLSVSPASNTTYTVIGTSAAGCVKSNTTGVTVTSAPVITVSSASLCAGSSAILSASGVTTYTWNTGSNNASLSVSPSATTVYTVTGNMSGCATQALQTATVTVSPLPSVSLTSSTDKTCVNSAPVTLAGVPSGGTYAGQGVSGNIFNPSISGAGTFTLMYSYTNANNCTGSATLVETVQVCTGIEELSNGELVVFPNPAKETVTVKLATGLTGNSTIELYDAIGKMVISQKVMDAATTVYIDNLAKGIYTLRIVSANKQTVRRIIKE